LQHGEIPKPEVSHGIAALQSHIDSRERSCQLGWHPPL